MRGSQTNIIYTVRNRVTGKVYVGQSTQGLAHRKSEHLWRLKSGTRDHKLYQAMRKHGADAFDFEIVCHALSADYLDSLERELIASFNSYRRGYNMTEGGHGVSAETRAKLSKVFSGRAAPWSRDSLNRLWGAGKLSRDRTNIPRGAASPMAESYIVREPNGDQLHVSGLRAYCRERGLSHASMFATLSGLQNHHKNYTIVAKLPRHVGQANLAAA